MKRVIALPLLLLALFCGAVSAPANNLTVTPNPDGTVMMVADPSVIGVARIALTFSYASTFLEPRIILQGGDYSFDQMARDSKPGFLKLDIRRDGEEMQEADLVLIADFDDKPADQPCAVNFVAATYTYADGRTASPSVIILPPIVVKKPEPSPVAQQSPVSMVASVSPAVPSTPARGGQSPQRTEGRSAEQGTSGGNEKDVAGANLPDLDYQACPDPLQRFRNYRGEKNPSALLSLFASANPCRYRQEPPAAVSDGGGKVKISFETDSASQRAPDFGVTGARLLSLWQDSGRSWTAELLPNRGEHDVVLYVVTGGVLKRISLAVAPPLDLFLDRLSRDEALSPLLEYTIAVNRLAARSNAGANQGR